MIAAVSLHDKKYSMNKQLHLSTCQLVCLTLLALIMLMVLTPLCTTISTQFGYSQAKKSAFCLVKAGKNDEKIARKREIAIFWGFITKNVCSQISVNSVGNHWYFFPIWSRGDGRSFGEKISTRTSTFCFFAQILTRQWRRRQLHQQRQVKVRKPQLLR